MNKTIALLGSTGSIGTQALEVIRNHPGQFSVSSLVANMNANLLIKQALEFNPTVVVISEEKREQVSEALKGTAIRVLSGENGLLESVSLEETDLVLSAMVGSAGLTPTLSAIIAGKNIALANKETLVVAGELIMREAKKNGVTIIPVDSEHSAIYQCLVGENLSTIRKIILTASGGPFRGMTSSDLNTVTKGQALNHPNWEMGAKVTIDSATLMNKGLEVIEAKWLFDLSADQIEVIVHPQSIIHSMVEFNDGSIKAQLGTPDMRLPIQYAFTFPGRADSYAPSFDFRKYPELTFESPDYETFPCLALAIETLNKGGNYPCAMNAANEIAVDAFLNEKILFAEIPDIIRSSVEKVTFVSNPGLADLLATDEEARAIATEQTTAVIP